MSKMDPAVACARQLVRNIVRDALLTWSGPFDPITDAIKIFREQTSARDRTDLQMYRDQISYLLFIEEAKRQTASKPFDDDDGSEPDLNLYHADRWLPSASGLRIKERDATWKDHQTHREAQIKAMRRANKRFELDELKRERLASAGMLDDPNMTSDEAAKKIGWAE